MENHQVRPIVRSPVGDEERDEIKEMTKKELARQRISVFNVYRSVIRLEKKNPQKLFHYELTLVN